MWSPPPAQSSAPGLGNRVVFLSITVDPGRDTRAQLAAYRNLYAPAPADWLTPTAVMAWVYRGKGRQDRHLRVIT
jgi:hypothetical protein